MDKLEDEELISLVREGSKQALGCLFARYSRLVFSVGVRILRDFSEAEELVQDVFLNLFRKSHIFDPLKGSLRSWLVQMVYTKALDRREYLAVRRFYDYTEIQSVVDSVSSSEDLEMHTNTSELREHIKRAFAELTQAQRRTLEMFFFEGYTLREISVKMDESVGATRNHYYRGLEKLRGKLSPSMSPTWRERG